MGALPRTVSTRLRPIHTRGIARCVSQGMTDVAEIAEACAIPRTHTHLVEESLTTVQKMAMGKSRKKKERDEAPLEDDAASG